MRRASTSVEGSEGIGVADEDGVREADGVRDEVPDQDEDDVGVGL